MISEKRTEVEEAPSSAQLTVILVVSAAFVSAGIFFSSKVMGFKFPQAQEYAAVSRQVKMNKALDPEMKRKYDISISKIPKPGKVRGRIPLPTMAPIFLSRK